MPKLNVSLGYSPDGMFWPSLDDTDNGSVGIGRAATPRAACRAAARALRAAAFRFDVLAEEPEPTHEATHHRVNRTPIS